jgi:ATP-binding cassette subfamily B protein
MFRNIRPLFPYLAKYKAGLIGGGICVLLMNGVWAFFPRIIGHVVDDMRTGITRESLVFYAVLILVVAGWKAYFQFLTRWILIGISRDIEFDLRNDLFRHLEVLSYDFYQRTRTGDIMARTTNDLNAVRMMLGPAIMYSANTVVFAAFALTFMWQYSPKLMLYAFAPLPFASVIIQYFGSRIHDRFEKIQATFSDISARVQENLSGARLIRAYVQEEAEIRHFERTNLEYIGRSMKLVQLMGMLWPTLQTMLGLAFVLVLFIGGREVLRGNINAGDFSAFSLYMIMLTWPIIALGWVINIYQRGSASMGRLAEIMHEKPTITDGAAKLELAEAPVRGEIEFREVSFQFPGAKSPVIKNINLSISAGSSLAIVGPTGSGKTTLAYLLARVYDPTEGTVLLDERPLPLWPLHTLRKNLGFVPQETFLFSATIRENIAFGSEERPLTDVVEAATVAGIADDIEDFPAKYETLVGERGITLSGGQKQRTAIARAVIRDPRILVLDDALSSVDTYTEGRILTHLRDVMQDRTTILVSHRVSTIRNADRIAVLHDGEIVEYGTHDELIRANRYYTDLHNKQLLEEELAITE